MTLTALFSLLAAVVLPVRHYQVPVVADKDVAVAVVSLPEGAQPSLRIKAKGLPRKALQDAWLQDSLVYVHLDGSRLKRLDKPFSLKINAKGFKIVSSGALKHRVAVKVRTAGDDGVAAYRIPGLVTTRKGTLVAVYDIRRANSQDLQGDIDVGVCRSTDGGLTWGPMIVAMDMGEWGGLPQDVNGIGDPCILLDEVTGDLLLFAAWSHGGKAGDFAWWTAGDGFEPGQTPQLMMVRSKDDGQTWSEPVNLTRQIKQEDWRFTFQGPGRGITMDDGTLVIPFQHQEPDRTPAAGLIWSTDRGETWQIRNYAKINTTESQVVELDPGELMLNMRDNRGTGRAVYVTRDFGQTWTPHASDGTLVEPVCMASLLKVRARENALGRDILLFSNPADSTQRRNITVRLSTDGGVSWPSAVLLDEGTGWGYSCLSMIDRKTVGILYESSEAHMTFQAIPLKELR